jgi:hypothetical protein
MFRAIQSDQHRTAHQPLCNSIRSPRPLTQAPTAPRQFHVPRLYVLSSPPPSYRTSMALLFSTPYSYSVQRSRCLLIFVTTSHHSPSPPPNTQQCHYLDLHHRPVFGRRRRRRRRRRRGPFRLLFVALCFSAAAVFSGHSVNGCKALISAARILTRSSFRLSSHFCIQTSRQ